MFSAVFKVLALAAVALAIPATDSQGIADGSDGDVTLCTGPYPFGGCANWPFNNGICFDFNGGKRPYYKNLNGVSVPTGHICILHNQAGCRSGPAEYGILNAGSYNLEVDVVPNGVGGFLSFNKTVVAMLCVQA